MTQSDLRDRNYFNDSKCFMHISGIDMAGHMNNEVIRAFILKALMLLVFIRTFPSSS